jgi:hypothetical protein
VPNKLDLTQQSVSGTTSRHKLARQHDVRMLNKPKGGNDMGTRGRSQKPWQRAFVTIAAIVVGSFMLIFGAWSLLFPRSFDAFIDFPPYNEHLLHDVGAFQIGIGISVLLSLMWSDSIGVALVAFVVAGTIHSINHALDRHLDGHPLDQWELAGLVLVALAALIVHLWGGSRQEE